MMPELYDLQKRLLRHEPTLRVDLQLRYNELNAIEVSESFHALLSALVSPQLYKDFAKFSLANCWEIEMLGQSPTKASAELGNAMQAIDWLLGGRTEQLLKAEDELGLAARYASQQRLVKFAAAFEDWCEQ